MIVTLERYAFLADAVIGILTAGRFRCHTLERPWKNNERFDSCIPDGVYQCRPFDGARFRGVVEVTDVPDRSSILIHAANYAYELEGCIAVGHGCHFDSENGSRIWESRKALAGLFEHAGQDFVLHCYSRAALPLPQSHRI